jgi:hypothetical protein
MIHAHRGRLSTESENKDLHIMSAVFCLQVYPSGCTIQFCLSPLLPTSREQVRNFVGLIGLSGQ